MLCYHYSVNTLTFYCLLPAAVPLVSAAELKLELESLQYREHRRLAVQGHIMAVTYLTCPKSPDQVLFRVDNIIFVYFLLNLVILPTDFLPTQAHTFMCVVTAFESCCSPPLHQTSFAEDIFLIDLKMSRHVFVIISKICKVTCN